AQGPVASQEIIKELGTNGGGFFNANSAHPFENPNALTNFLTNFAIILIPAAMLYMFGRMVGNTRQGWVLWAVCGIIVVLGLAVALPAGGNFEGKEVRFGIAASVLWAVVTTATSCGAVNAMHDSLQPLAGMI